MTSTPQTPPARGTSTSLLTKCLALAEDDPKSMLPYLQTLRNRDVIQATDVLSQLSELKKVRVLCQRDMRWPLSESYLPTAKLQFLCKRYMLEDEKFPFLELEKPLQSSEGFGPWGFLQSHFEVKANDDLDFYLQLVYFIRRHSSMFFKELEFPRRILELYLRIYAACSSSSNPQEAQQKVRTFFEDHELILRVHSWAKPSICLQKGSIHMTSKVVVLPPQKAWEASDTESADLTKFYRDILGIPTTYSWIDILNQIQRDQCKTNLQYKPTILSNTPKYYKALDEMIPHLSDQDTNDLRSSFDNKPYIGLASGSAVTWYKPVDCVWAPGFNVPGKLDLSEHYPQLEMLFVGLLKIPKHTSGMVYKELVNLDPKEIPVNTVKDMLWSLNSALPKYGHFMDPEKFRKRPVLPVKETNGQVNLCSAETEYFIPDREFLHQQFSIQVRMLDFTPHEIWLLEPLIVWASIEHLYLSWNVGVATYLSDATPESVANISAARALGILRIASHFRSPRVNTPGERRAVLAKLEQSQFLQTDGIYLRLTLKTSKSVLAVDKIETDLHIEESDDQLSIYMPRDEEAQEFSLISRLPRRLVSWMMADPISGEGRIDELAVSLVKSILRARDTLVSAVLDAEGVVKAEDLDPKKKTKEQRYGPGPSRVEFGSGSSESSHFKLSSERVPAQVDMEPGQSSTSTPRLASPATSLFKKEDVCASLKRLGLESNIKSP